MPFLLVLFRSDRKSTRLNSTHTIISYAAFCLQKTIVPGPAPAPAADHPPPGPPPPPQRAPCAKHWGPLFVPGPEASVEGVGDRYVFLKIRGRREADMIFPPGFSHG